MNECEYSQDEIVLAKKKNEKDYRTVDVSGVKIGAGNFALIAGPCAVEEYETTLHTALEVKKAGASIFRAGAFKPRTSPYSFDGLHEEGLEILKKVKEKAGIPVACEIIDAAYLPLYDDIDVLQIGARNMQNFELLKAVGRQNKPVILKRGMSATLQELLLSAEYILVGGNPNVILCERGIRTFTCGTRNTFDVGAIPLLKTITALPVIADPSHATGRADLVESVALAAVAAGADGVMTEVHICPAASSSDACQTIDTAAFGTLSKKADKVRQALL